MSLLEMKKVRICALKSHRKNLLESLQRKGILEIHDFGEYTDKLERSDTQKFQNTFEKSISQLSQAIKIIEPFSKNVFKAPNALSGKKNLSTDDYYVFANEVDEVMRVTHRIIVLDREISENNAEIFKFETQIESLEPWKNFDLPMKNSETKYSATFIGTLPYECNLEQILKKLDHVHVEIISSSSEQTCIFVLCKKENSKKTEDSLREMGFSAPQFFSQKSPVDKIKELNLKISELRAQIESNKIEIGSYIGTMNAIRFMIDYYTMRIDKYKIIDKLGSTEKTFFIYAYIPSKSLDNIKCFLEKTFNAYIEILDIKENEKAPIILKNNAFASPAESVVESYSLPGKKDIDPTFIMSIFYYVLFGMMLSDAAYGIIMTLGCFFAIKKFKNMENSMKKSLKLFMYCGISTTFWGVMFGSFFGDAVEVISKTFFNFDFSLKPLWFAPIDKPMKMLTFSFLIGLLHIFSGLIIKIYQSCIFKKYKDAIFDGVFWLVLVCGIVFYMLSSEMICSMLEIDFVLPKSLGQISALSSLVSAIGILFTAGRESKSFIKRFLKGLYGLYGLSGYLSDVLSYARLLALGLATGVIGTVFNKMASMAGNGILGAIIFLIVFLIGHSMNIGINLLGAYVHTNRLQFVEFFGKFYEGGGRKFLPFKIKTRYYNIQEDVING